jgi:hypothetical protein
MLLVFVEFELTPLQSPLAPPFKIFELNGERVRRACQNPDIEKEKVNKLPKNVFCLSKMQKSWARPISFDIDVLSLSTC